MRTNISSQFQNNPDIADAEKILRACVHCGFCTATCPTYQLLGDELDGPRGRIYLIKQVLEGEAVSAETQLHLDRCLTCRSCETTCPSGVQYGRLVDIGRGIVEQQVSRSFSQKMQHWLLRKTVPYPRRFAVLIKLGSWMKFLLSKKLKQKLPPLTRNKYQTAKPQARKMLVLQGCAQAVVTPTTNYAASKVLETLGIELFSAEKAGCCGALSYHLAAHDEGKNFMRNNIDAWWPYVEQGVEAIVITASGCGATVKEYGDLLKHDSTYTDKAKRISELAKDISEIVAQEDLSTFTTKNKTIKVAFHNPCSLQHGQQLNNTVETILQKAGFILTDIEDSHLCCGSAGTYSILQPKISQQLLENKIVNLEKGNPQIIATANIGCQLHLASAASIPVKYWIELLSDLK